MTLKDKQMQTHPINLEGCSDSELRAVRADPTAHTNVQRMAGLLLSSRAERLAGNIEAASNIERKFDRIYATLPEHLRW